MTSLVHGICSLLLVACCTSPLSLLSGCETEDDIKVYKVEYREIDSLGTCECHIRLDNVTKGEDTITCITPASDTLSYVVLQ